MVYDGMVGLFFGGVATENGEMENDDFFSFHVPGEGPSTDVDAIPDFGNLWFSCDLVLYIAKRSIQLD